MHLTIRIFVVLFLFSINVHSQIHDSFQAILDSSLSVVKSSPDDAFHLLRSINRQALTPIQKGQYQIAMGNLHYSVGSSMDSVSSRYVRGFEHYSAMGEDSLAFESLFELGIKHRRTGLYNEAKQLYQQASAFATKTKQEVLHGDAINALGVIHYFQGENLMALRHYLEAMRVYEKAKNPAKIAKSYNNIGIIYKLFNNYNLAIEYYQKSLEIRKQNNLSNRNAPYFNLNELHHFIGEHRKALSYSLEAYKLAKKENNKTWQIDLSQTLFKDYLALDKPDSMLIMANQFQALVEKNRYDSAIYDKLLAQYHIKTNAPRKALARLEGAVAVFEENTDINNLEWMNLYMGEAFLQLKQYESAIWHINKALRLATEEQYSPMINLSLERLHDAYKMSGDFENAYEALQKVRAREDSIYNESKASIIGGMEARMNLVEEENKTSLLLKDSEIKNVLIKNQKITIWLIALTFLGLSIITYLLLSKEKARKELAETRLHANLEKRKTIEAELNYKNQELINFAVQISEKNEFIQSLKKHVTKIKTDEHNQKDLKLLEDAIKANESITKDRNEFENHVQNVYEGFFQTLGQQFPDISISEKRLAALLRLELSSKEISTVLNISPKSVDMSRYRLRKKMGLDSKSNLVEVLQSI